MLLFIVLFLFLIYALTSKNTSLRTGVLAVLSPFLTLGLIVAMITWFLAFYPSLSTPNPPKPEIEQAEFPFTLEYTINDTPVTIEDVLVCKFNGFHYNTYEAAKKWTWRSYYKSKSGEPVLLKQEDVTTVYKDSVWIEEEGPYNVRIYLDPGLPSYFMGDADEDPYHGPTVYYEVYDAEGHRIIWQGIYDSDIYDSPLLAAYGIKITRWEIADPIENTFS